MALVELIAQAPLAQPPLLQPQLAAAGQPQSLREPPKSFFRQSSTGRDRAGLSPQTEQPQSAGRAVTTGVGAGAAQVEHVEQVEAAHVLDECDRLSNRFRSRN